MRFVQNSLSTAAYQFTAMLMGFVVPRITILYYGSEVNGLVVSVTEFLTYFRMVESGLAAIAVCALYEPLAKRDNARVSAVVSAARGFYNIAGLVFCGLTLLFAFLYPRYVFVHDVNGMQMAQWSVFILIVAMGLSGALEFFTLARYRVLLNADQRMYMISLTSMLSLLVSTALIVILPYLGYDIIVVRLAASLTLLIRSVILAIYVKKHYPQVDAFAKPDKSALKQRWDALYYELTISLHQGAGVMLTTIVTRDTAIISVYGVYHMVTVGLWGILKMVTTGIYSSFGNLIASGNKRGFQVAYRDFECLYYMVSCILFSVAAVLIVPFAVLYTDGIKDANYYAPAIGMLVVLDALTDHAKIPLDLMISSTGRFQEVRHHCTLQNAVTIVLGLAFGYLGLRVSVTAAVCGVMVAVILSNIVRAICQLRFVPSQITGIPWQKTALRIARMFVQFAMIAIPCLLWLPTPNRFFTWVAYSVPLLIYASAVTLFVTWLFDRESLRSLVGRVTYLLQKKR